MTREELDVLTKALAGLSAALTDHKETSAQIGELLAGQAGMRATLGNLEKVAEQQHAKLFQYHDLHEKRLAKIEQAYVPRDGCERLQDQMENVGAARDERNREEHEEFARRINELSVRMAKVGGAIALGTAGLNWIASNWHWLVAGQS